MRSVNEIPLVSVITITYNCEDTISHTIDSVASQSYKRIEHIIKDGGSTDSTAQVVSKKKGPDVYFYQCKDEGIYDALNQAVAHCTGEYIILLHSNDTYKSSTTIEKLVSIFLRTNSDGLYGNVEFVNSNSHLVREWTSSSFKRWKLYFGWMPPHTSLILRNKVYEQEGPFDKQFKVSGDYEFMLRVFKKNKYKFLYIDNVVTVMPIGGASTSGLSSQLTKVIEDWRAIRTHRLLGLFTLILKRISKLGQWRCRP